MKTFAFDGSMKDVRYPGADGRAADECKERVCLLYASRKRAYLIVVRKRSVPADRSRAADLKHRPALYPLRLHAGRGARQSNIWQDHFRRG